MARDPDSGTTPLHAAASGGHVAAMDWLLAHIHDHHSDTAATVAALRAVDDRQRTPLHAAAAAGHTGVLEVVLVRLHAAGAAHATAASLASARDGDGRTAMQLAALEGHAEVVRMLARCVGAPAPDDVFAASWLPAAHECSPQQIEAALELARAAVQTYGDNLLVPEGLQGLGALCHRILSAECHHAGQDGGGGGSAQHEAPAHQPGGGTVPPSEEARGTEPSTHAGGGEGGTTAAGQGAEVTATEAGGHDAPRLWGEADRRSPDSPPSAPSYEPWEYGDFWTGMDYEPSQANQGPGGCCAGGGGGG